MGRTACITDLRPRQKVPPTQARNPKVWKLGSPPVVIMIPTTTGMSEMYVTRDSNLAWISAASMAVKKGVVAPIAWLKETGMYLSDTFPSTIEVTKTPASVQIFTSCDLVCTYCRGKILVKLTK